MEKLVYKNAEEVYMQDNVIILQKISDQKLLAKYYSMADVFVICSMKENFPTTCIEAQCCGTPVVGFDTGGTKETSVYSENDFVRYGDIEALEKKVSKMLNTGKSDIVKKSQEAYSKENMSKRYMEEYDRTGYKKKILLIDVNCKNSSTGKIVYDLYQNIRDSGREAAICYGRGALVREEDIYKFGIDIETKVHAGLARLTGYNGCFSPISTKHLIQYIDMYQPDLIHIHELHAYFVNIKELISHIKKKAIPVVWTFHCEYMYTGKCGHAYECTKFQQKCGHCPAVRDYPKSLFFDKTSQMLAMKKNLLTDWDFTVVVPSQWLADRVKMSFLKNKRVKVIHNGIDTSIFSPVDASNLKKELGIPEKNKVVLAVAPNIMSEQKGGKWVLELAKKMESRNNTFILIGKV